MAVENAAAPEACVNPVKKMLADRDYVLGTTVAVTSPETAAHVFALGFDFLWIEMEHSPITLETLRNMVLATRGLNAVPIVRVPVNELRTTKRMLDMGALGVIFPFCGTPELARQVVAACKYPSVGRRGSGAGLASLRWMASEGCHALYDNDGLMVIILEQEETVHRVDEMAATPSVDVIFIGTSDLSFSMRYRGQMDHPRVQESVRRVLAASRANTKAVGLPLKSPEQIKRRVDKGFQCFQTSSEFGLITAGASQLLEPLGRLSPSAQKGMLY